MTVVTPTLTRCDLCQSKMAALPGPMRKIGRPEPPPGYMLGWIQESADGQIAKCQVCVANLLPSSVQKGRNR